MDKGIELISQFKDVPINWRFDFPTGWECIKTSSRKYKYNFGGEWWEVEVGTTEAHVFNVRQAYQWELDQFKEEYDE